MALASRRSLPLQLLRHASFHLGAGALSRHRRPPHSARLQLSAAASSYKEAAGHDGTAIAAASTTCAPVEAVDAAPAAEQLGEARRDHPYGGPSCQPKELGNRREDMMSNPSPPGPPVEGSGGNGGAHN